MLIVTALAAGAVVWLSWETRRSAKASEKAAAAANAALDLARAEESHSRQLVAEAIRSRIDGQAPSLTIVPRDEMRIVNEVELPIRFPAADHKALYVAVGFSVTNDSPTSVVLRWRTLPHANGRSAENDSAVLVPGQRQFIAIQVSRPLSEWRAVADWQSSGDDDEANFREAHQVERDARIVFSYVAPADDGVADEYTFRLVGSPLTRLPDADDSYGCAETDQVINKGEVHIVAEPRRRTYYLSRRRGLELPSPDMRVPGSKEIGSD